MNESKMAEKKAAASDARAELLIAVAADCAAAARLEQIESGAEKIGPKQAAKAAESIGADVILSLAYAASSDDGARMAGRAARHWQSARAKLAKCSECHK